MSSPDEIRRNIDATRESLSADVEALQDKVSPARIVERRVEKTKTAVGGVKDKIMGSADSATSTAGSSLSSAATKASDSVSAAGDALAAAPGAVKTRAQGNPLAAGLIAFGAGWLASSLLPATSTEKDLANKAKQSAQPLIHQLSEHATEIKDNMQAPLQDAVESVKTTVTDAAAEVNDQTKSAVQDIQSQAMDSKDAVAGSHSEPVPPTYTGA
jgi:gas vesicle protein